jgi:hypothetical protein
MAGKNPTAGINMVKTTKRAKSDDMDFWKTGFDGARWTLA